ncbi:hypothetical protein Ciccas_007574 [Cichlidogyrus casuarinus]|uniref:PiggyBac transposable element-derived protein domain-containing protein n=1 Tax=Cichlidogyrus casuarinus TaxID=1844966 RepID=A0ABD2Q6J1_9PLAT
MSQLIDHDPEDCRTEFVNNIVPCIPQPAPQPVHDASLETTNQPSCSINLKSDIYDRLGFMPKRDDFEIVPFAPLKTIFNFFKEYDHYAETILTPLISTVVPSCSSTAEDAPKRRSSTRLELWQDDPEFVQSESSQNIWRNFVMHSILIKA